VRFYISLSLLVLSLALGGCLGLNSGGDEDPVSAGLSYYYAEFSDVAIPNEMKVESKDTFITYTADGVKLGTQLFKGRVEMSSLLSALQGYMHRDSWNLRSMIRGNKGAILIFEKQQRMCSMYVFEDLINTGLLVYVSPKLPDGALQNSVPASTPMAQPVYTPPAAQPIPSSTGNTSSGNITVYPVQ